MNDDNDFTSDDPESARTSDPSEAPGHAELGETAQLTPDTLSNRSAAQGTAANDESWTGKVLGKYLITGVLGRGGMGIVLKARDPLIERDVAIKLLAEHLATDEISLKRFLAEARAAGKLSHANVVSIYEIGQQDNAYYLVMEYVPGGSLSERLESNGPCSVLEATQATIDAAQGLAAAHAAGLIHRDVKPANFMCSSDGSVKVTDFGLVKSNNTQSQVTQIGSILGTPFYMSPEQCMGTPIDARSDIYSLGATYYSLLTGHEPFHKSTGVPQIMFAHCHGPIPDPRDANPSIPVACSRIVARAMAKAPEERYQSVNEMLADLEHIRGTLSGQNIAALPSESGTFQPMPGAPVPVPAKPVLGRRALFASAGAGIVFLLAALIGLWSPWSRLPQPENLPAAAPAAPLLHDPVKIGALCSLSGTMAESESVIVDTLLFAVDEINQAGGVLGRPLQVVVGDGRSDPETFAREAERLITQENVHALFGCWTSDSRKAVREIVEQQDHLLIYPLQYEGIEASPNIIYMGAAPNQQILPAIQWASTTLGKKRFFLVGSDYLFPRAAHEIIKNELTTLGGEVVGERYLRLGSTDVQDIVQAIGEAQPDIIINTINGDSNIAFFRARREAGLTSTDCPTLSFSIGEQGLRSMNPRDIEGDYAAWTYFQSVDNAENRQFVASFHEKHPQLTISDPMESAYAGLLLWARAANDAQTLDPKRIRRAMLDQRFPGPAGEVRLDADNQHSYKTPRIGQLQSDGQFRIVWEANAPVKPDPYPPGRTTTAWGAFLHDLYQGWDMRWSPQ